MGRRALLGPIRPDGPSAARTVLVNQFDVPPPSPAALPVWRALAHPDGTAEPHPAATGRAGDYRLGVTDDEAMGLALAEAALAPAHGDVPVGAVALVDGSVVARRHNERELRADPSAHAELLAIRDAARHLGTWRLERVTVVVTLEPCPMCAGALVAGRVGRVVFATPDPKAGACGSLYNLCADPRLNHEVVVAPGVRGPEAAALLTQFFAARR